MDRIEIDGEIYQGTTVALPHVPLLLIVGRSGMLGCGYVSMDAAEKFGDALAVVTGVGNYDEMLSAPVARCSAAAARLGVVPGMSGRDALRRMSAGAAS